jgi:hypothetical protein
MIRFIKRELGGIDYFKVLNSMSSVLLSTAYLPNVQYLSSVIHHDHVVIEKHENFVKQTFRNRCDIVTANGTLSLSIPLVKQADKELIFNKKISYAEDWQKQHWRTIVSAYKNSPYFEFFEDEFRPFYETQFEYLLDYNTQLLNVILNILRVKKQIDFSTDFELNPLKIADRRGLSEIKNNSILLNPYYQVFADKFGFISNMSCLDALFNIGLRTLELCTNEV